MNIDLNSLLKRFAGLASAFALCTTAALAQDAATEEEADEPVEEIVVRGIRSSIEDAINRKRMASQIMDAISAEDIGKLPDENIGEALQRITGISLEREAGEGKEVSVRGLGAGLSQVTVNGQKVVSTEGNRSFNFSVLDSSVVSALEVWKSPMAMQDEGAVGGSVNIVTRGPLDSRRTIINLRAGGQYEDLTDEWSEKYDGQFSTANDARTVGISLSANYSDRLTRSDQVIIPGWSIVDSSSGDWGSRNWDELAAAEGLDYIIYPRDASSRVRLYDRQRSGFNTTLQFQPSDKLDVRLDAFSSTLEDYDINQTSQVRIRDLVSGGGRDVTDYVWEFDGNNALFFDTAGANIRGGWRGLRNIATLRENEWKSQGVKAQFDVLLESGAVWSFQAGTSDGDGARTTYPVVDFRESTGFSVDLRDDPRFPQAVVEDGFTDDQLDLWTVSINDRYDDQSNEFLQVDFTSKEVGQLDISTVRFGMKVTQEDLQRKQIRHAANRAGVSGTLDDFAQVCGESRCAVEDFTYADDTLAPFNGSFTLVDFDRVLEAYPRDTREERVAYDESWKVDERTLALYLQLDLDGEVFGVPYRGNVGARYYETDLTSSGWLDAEGTNPGSVERTYSDFLPSLNLVFVLQEDLLMRFSASKVIARPDQEDFSFGGNFNLEEQTARVGNPYLEPFRATALDLGLEWYFADASLLSAAAFYKDVKSFVSNGVIEGGIIVETSDGPLEFDAIGPINGEGAKIKGLEFGYQQVFAFLPSPFDGFGTQLNYTYTDSTVEIPYNEGGQTYQMPLEGLSKSSYNAVLFWENDAVSVRVAYNYRDSFLSNRSNPQGNPVYTDEYGQLDASINWDITDRIGLIVSGVNLNDEARYQYFLTPDRMLAHRASGRRYAVTLRGRF